LAFDIRVDCYAGYRGEQEPRSFVLGERRFSVLEILDRWFEPGARYFKVKADDGRTFILRHDSVNELWALSALVGER